MKEAATLQARAHRNARRLASAAYMAGWRSYNLEDGHPAAPLGGLVYHSPVLGWESQYSRSSQVGDLPDLNLNFFDAISVEEANEVWELCLYEPDSCADTTKTPTPYME